MIGQVTISVTTAAAGTSVEDGLSWSFADGNNSGVVDSDGNIDLTRLNPPPEGNTVELTFALTNSTISFSDGPATGDRPISFFGASDGGADAMIIDTGDGQGKAVHTTGEFHDFSLGLGYQTLTVVDDDNDGRAYPYGLRVWVDTNENGPGTGRTFVYDPEIKNEN